ncbi:hypothetical protein [Streptomyces sp. NPDC059009]|uniref:hypothetical protein n=1 Tax=Streptomyces sp. NPDC059009 TaxID=3346694 RepID=UPI0036AF2A7D
MTDTSSSCFHVRAVLTTGGLWQPSIDELPEVEVDPTRSLSRLGTLVRQAIAEHEGLDREALVLEIVPSTGDEGLDQQLTDARNLRREADQLAEQARTAAEPLAKRLARAGVSQRDAGALLGISAASVSALNKKK